MIARWNTRMALLLICSLSALAGCLQENSITITNDGRVKFEVLVTETDPQKKIDSPTFQTAVANMLTDLKQHKWQVEESWLSKQRPYRLKVTGSGKLVDVVGTSASYTLTKLADKKYTLSLQGSEANLVRVVFNSPEGSARILDAAGKPVHEIESATPADTYTIVLQ